MAKNNGLPPVGDIEDCHATVVVEFDDLSSGNSTIATLGDSDEAPTKANGHSHNKGAAAAAESSINESETYPFRRSLRVFMPYLLCLVMFSLIAIPILIASEGNGVTRCWFNMTESSSSPLLPPDSEMEEIMENVRNIADVCELVIENDPFDSSLLIMEDTFGNCLEESPLFSCAVNAKRVSLTNNETRQDSNDCHREQGRLRRAMITFSFFRARRYSAM